MVTIGLSELPLRLLGCVVMLALMLLEPNRVARAWSVWVIVILAQGALSLVSLGLGAVVSAAVAPYAGLVFALGVLWLVMPYSSRKGWPTTFWSAFMVILFGTCMFGYSKESSSDDTQNLLLLVSVAFSSALSFALGVRSCRENPSPGTFIAWALLWTYVCWVVTGIPWVVMAVTQVGWFGLSAILAVFMFAAVGFGITLAFVVLSAIEPFYRGRFKAFLGELPAPKPPHAPPVIAVPVS